MLLLNQEILVILLHVTCGIYFGIMKSLVDLLMLLSKRLFYRVLVDAAFIIASGSLFLYVMYITTDFNIQFVDVLLILLGFILYTTGPMKLIKGIKSAVIEKIVRVKKTKIYKFLFK